MATTVISHQEQQQQLSMSAELSVFVLRDTFMYRTGQMDQGGPWQIIDAEGHV